VLPAAPVLALLDVGPTEFLLIAALFLLLFGADKVPDLARSIGKATARFRSASKQFQDEVARERGEVFRPGDAVPREQLAQVEQADLAREQELNRLRSAARSLGIDPAGLDEASLRGAIAARMQRETP
jgi:sec-independent protein translocase protein TatA